MCRGLFIRLMSFKISIWYLRVWKHGYNVFDNYGCKVLEIILNQIMYLPYAFLKALIPCLLCVLFVLVSSSMFEYGFDFWIVKAQGSLIACCFGAVDNTLTAMCYLYNIIYLLTEYKFITPPPPPPRGATINLRRSRGQYLYPIRGDNKLTIPRIFSQ